MLSSAIPSRKWSSSDGRCFVSTAHGVISANPNPLDFWQRYYANFACRGVDVVIWASTPRNLLAAYKELCWSVARDGVEGIYTMDGVTVLNDGVYLPGTDVAVHIDGDYYDNFMELVRAMEAIYN